MYQALIFCHSLMRWLVLASLIYAICRACRGSVLKATFTKTDDAIRHWTATMTHIQMVIGMILYFQSPVTHYFRAQFKEAVHSMDTTFFGLIHPLLMLAAITTVTIGSGLAKRRKSDSGKFKTQLLWFSAALLLVLLAIPWPFSPFASRPYFR